MRAVPSSRLYVRRRQTESMPEAIVHIRRSNQASVLHLSGAGLETCSIQPHLGHVNSWSPACGVDAVLVGDDLRISWKEDGPGGFK